MNKILKRRLTGLFALLLSVMLSLDSFAVTVMADDTTGKVIVINGSSEKNKNITPEYGAYFYDYDFENDCKDLDFTKPVCEQSAILPKGKIMTKWELWYNDCGHLGSAHCEGIGSDIIDKEKYDECNWELFCPYLIIYYKTCLHRMARKNESDPIIYYIKWEKSTQKDNYLTGTCPECGVTEELPTKVYEANKQPGEGQLSYYEDGKVYYFQNLNSSEIDLSQTINKNYDNDKKHISKWELWSTFNTSYKVNVASGSGNDKIKLDDYIKAISTLSKDGNAEIIFPVLYREYEDHTYVNGVCSGCGRTDPTYIAPPKEDKPAADTEDKHAEPAKKGTKLTPAGETSTYKVTKSGSNPTVAYTKADKKAKNVVIPEIIKDENGVSYMVTEIASGAFKNNTSLKKVIISANIEKIRKNAFSGCKNLKTVTIKSKKIKSIEKNAFKGISKNAKISVPKKKKQAYTKLLKKAKYNGKIK